MPAIKPLADSITRSLLLLGFIGMTGTGPASAGPAGDDPGWASRVSEEIRISEYRFSENGAGSWSAPNRAHNLRSAVGRNGLEVVSRDRGTDAWRLGLSLEGIGRRSSLRAVAPGQVSGRDNRVEILRRGIVEWFVNDERGLEHGFTVEEPPLPDGGAGEALILEMSVSGSFALRLESDRRGVSLTPPSGQERLRYAGLQVLDAAGSALPAWMEIEPGRIRIAVDDTDAVYPLEIDPLLGSGSWSAVGDGAFLMGFSVATAGDVNGDGYSDIVVGAPGYDHGEFNEGAVLVYLGGASGPAFSPDWIVEGNAAGIAVGASVSTAGDVNADGFDDLIVGVPAWSSPELFEGAAFLWLGGPGGLGAGGSLTTADWSYESNNSQARLGVSVAPAGDVDGTGFADVLIGAPYFTNGHMQEGRAFLFVGVSGGLAAFPAWTAESNQACPVPSSCDGPLFGYSVGTAGDVNGDGFSDIIIGAPSYYSGSQQLGRVFVWHGASGFGALPDGTPSNASWWAEGNIHGYGFGQSAATAGDLDGDGYADIVVGAPRFLDTLSEQGAAFVFMGGPAGLGVIGSTANADWDLVGGQQGAELGTSVGTAGDVNGDGFADLALGAPGAWTSFIEEGIVYVFHGKPGGLNPAATVASADWSDNGLNVGARMGHSLGAAGDVNGDGFGDLLTGAPYKDQTFVDAGMARLYLGSPEEPLTTATWSEESDQVSALLGYSVDFAGDVNGDGFTDVIVGAPFFDDGETDEGKIFVYLGTAGGLDFNPAWSAQSNQVGANLGTSVASAGDVNGDGYADIIAGANVYTGTMADQGRVFVWHGGPGDMADPSGLGPDGDPSNADWHADGVTFSVQLGTSVSSAGDVNGDGFGDIIAGAPWYSNGESNEGMAVIFAGSPSGLSLTPYWQSESNSPTARFGASVSSAGDVDGDGFGDVIVGAPFDDSASVDGGAAHLFLGSADSMDPVPYWSKTSTGPGGHLGFAVASSGDVNGDGYSDILIGVPEFTNMFNQDGLVIVHYGGPFGPGPGPGLWFATGPQASARLGSAVSYAGDVNRDGYDDILVGARTASFGQAGEGMVVVWLGGPGGPPVPGNIGGSHWLVEGDSTLAWLGASVAGGGDVNGDGFPDLLIGAQGYSSPESNEGRALLYLGGGGDGLHRVPQQALKTDTAPIAPLGISDSINGFRLRAMGRSPAGRAGVKLQWEVKAWGETFDGTGLVEGPSFTDTGVPDFLDGSAVELSELVAGLDPGQFYRWRVRILGDSPYFPWSPWLTLPDNGLTETDLRTPGCLDLDGDGYSEIPDPSCPNDPVLDCDDTEGSAFPGGTELCDGIDNDCDGAVDDNDPEGGGLCNTGQPGICALGTYHCVAAGLVCFQDNQPAAETCNGLDDDCDGTLPPDEADADLDGVAECKGDCDDTRASVYPGAPELCDGLDNDCNGPVDENDPEGGGLCNTGLPGICSAGTFHCSAGSLVCFQDNEPALEICNGLDDDCDGNTPAEEVDDDRDGLAECEGDCDDTDDQSLATPSEVTGLFLEKSGNIWRATWDDQSATAGAGTVYDIHSGFASPIPGSGDWSGGQCEAEDVAGAPSYDYFGPLPPPGEALYFMLRGQNGCPVGTGTYGTRNRDATAAASSSPCL